MQKLSMKELDRMDTDTFKQTEKRLIVVVLDNVRSMHNVGSIFRTADAFLLQAIYLCGYTPQPPHRDIQKTALGATETVEWAYYEETDKALDFLQQQGYRLLAAEQSTGSWPLPGVHFAAHEKLAIIFGNEVEGVQQHLIDRCEACIEIPQWGTKHSLNVSVAAGIILWKLVEGATFTQPTIAGKD
jgi:23S rRNA (guanosine2251-2'-O)-methyltransferase